MKVPGFLSEVSGANDHVWLGVFGTENGRNWEAIVNSSDTRGLRRLSVVYDDPRTLGRDLEYI